MDHSFYFFEYSVIPPSSLLDYVFIIQSCKKVDLSCRGVGSQILTAI